jgi:predicted dehydrogenase
MIRIGLAGIGFMGYTHFEAAKKLKGAKITALASRNEAKLAGKWTGIRGNFGPPAGEVDTSKLAKYREFGDLIADPNIDLVDICTPPDQHESMVLAALAAGKHVLVEKPIALDTRAADRMVAAAAKAKRLLMVGQVLPFFPEFKFVADTVASGKYGKLRAAHFRRVICKPDWSADMADADKSGGPAIDLHIHDTHFISLLAGVPKGVRSSGIVENGAAQYLSTQYLYDEPAPAISAVSGGIAAKGLEFAHGFEVYLDKATILYEANTLAGEWKVNRPLTLVTSDGKAVEPKLKASPEWCGAFTQELQTAVEAVRTGVPARLLSGELARDALKLCHLETKSAATGKPVLVK